MWRKLFEDATRRQEEEKARLKRENNERSECLKQPDLEEPERNAARRNQPVELLTLNELSHTTEMQKTSGSGRLTIQNPSDSLGDPVVERTMRELVETAGRIVANRQALGSWVTAPYGTIDDAG